MDDFPSAYDAELGHPPEGTDYRAYVGPPEDYDIIGAMTFGLLTSLGLRQHHRLLDIGCGSLRVGRLLIPYLNPGCYFGIEPNRWLVKQGIDKEVGRSQIEIKKPTFLFSESARGLGLPGQFDFVLAQSIFSHSGQDVLDSWLQEIADLLASNGALAATFIMGETDTEEKMWVYPDGVTYRSETMKARATKIGFDFQILDWRHPRQTWALFAKREFDKSWLENRPLCWNTFLDFGTKARR